MILRFLLSILLVLALVTPSWARLAGIAGGAVATGTTSLSVAYPASVQAMDLLWMCVGNKYPTNSPTTPAGWTLPTNGQASGGFGADTTDLGHTYMTMYYKIADGTETGNLTVTVTSGNSAVARMSSQRSSTGQWSVTAANAAVNLSATAWSASMGTDPGLTTNDFVAVCSAGYTDATTFGTHAYAQNGITFGTVTEGFDQAVTDGDDMRFVYTSATVTAGTSSDASFVYTATASGLTGGSSVLIRVRESASTPTAFGGIGATGSGTNSYAGSLTFPAAVNIGDLIVLCIANKYPTNAPTIPTDAFGGTWVAPSSNQASGGTDPDSGGDTGHTYATMFYKISTAGTEDGGAISTDGITSGNSAIAGLMVYTNTTGLWSIAAANGADASIDAAWSVTAGADPSVVSGDMVITCSATRSDASLFTETTETLTQTGVTYGNSSERLDNGSSLGDDVGVKIVDFVAVAGTSSAAPVYAATITSTTSDGPTVFLRIRESAAAGAAIQSGSGFFPAIFQ